MDNHERPRGEVRLFCCGGAGMNIGHKVDGYTSAHHNNDSFARLEVVHLDTSRANVHRDIDPGSFYLVNRPGTVEGSGQERSENVEPISDRVGNILRKFKPADLNIVISSASGGSGAVIAATIVSELAAQDASTIAICVGDVSTRKFAQNTLKTLKTFERIAQTREQPVNIVWLQNSREMTRAAIDIRIQHVVGALCMLYSARNRELDAKDLAHWLRYHKVTSYEPQLASLTLVSDVKTCFDDLGNLISVATLTQADHDPGLPVRNEVQYVGYPEGALCEKLAMKAPWHFVISDGILPKVAAEVDKVLQEMQEQTDTRIRPQSISSASDVITSHGVVL